MEVEFEELISEDDETIHEVVVDGIVEDDVIEVELPEDELEFVILELLLETIVVFTVEDTVAVVVMKDVVVVGAVHVIVVTGRQVTDEDVSVVDDEFVDGIELFELVVEADDEEFDVTPVAEVEDEELEAEEFTNLELMLERLVKVVVVEEVLVIMDGLVLFVEAQVAVVVVCRMQVVVEAFVIGDVEDDREDEELLVNPDEVELLTPVAEVEDELLVESPSPLLELLFDIAEEEFPVSEEEVRFEDVMLVEAMLLEVMFAVMVKVVVPLTNLVVVTVSGGLQEVVTLEFVLSPELVPELVSEDEGPVEVDEELKEVELEEVEEVVDVPDLDSAAIPTPTAAIMMITITTIAIVEMAVLCLSIISISLVPKSIAVIYAKTIILPYSTPVSF